MGIGSKAAGNGVKTDGFALCPKTAPCRDGIVRAVEPGMKRVGGNRFTFTSGSDAQSD
jgi:hypothetical protein